jgi:hypothetical protein
MPEPKRGVMRGTDYDVKVRQVLARLRGGREWFMLRPGEEAEIVLISDIDDWLEIPVHRYEGQSIPCGLLEGESCAFCDEGSEARVRVAMHVRDVNTGANMVAVWAYGPNTILKSLADIYAMQALPFRGMHIKVKRTDSGKDRFSTYEVTYLGHKPITDPPMDAATLKRKALEQIRSWGARRGEVPNDNGGEEWS